MFVQSLTWVFYFLLFRFWGKWSLNHLLQSFISAVSFWGLIHKQFTQNKYCQGKATTLLRGNSITFSYWNCHEIREEDSTSSLGPRQHNFAQAQAPKCKELHLIVIRSDSAPQVEKLRTSTTQKMFWGLWINLHPGKMDLRVWTRTANAVETPSQNEEIETSACKRFSEQRPLGV